MKGRCVGALGLTCVVALTVVVGGVQVGEANSILPAANSAPLGGTGQAQTPIKHLVVIFDENVSFDHYFGTYPYATNPSGEPAFHASPNTPQVNGLSTALLHDNSNQSNPQRLDRSDALTCDQDHSYTAEQSAADHGAGAMDAVVPNTGYGATLAQCLAGLNEPIPADASQNHAVMDYYDGNTVTGLWNYAQHFAMDDNAFGTTYGPSSPGALNLVSANTYGAVCAPSSDLNALTPCPAVSDPETISASPGVEVAPGTATVTGDADPYYDVCS